MSVIDNHTRLLHMRDAAQDALSFIEGKSRVDLETDRLLGFAVVRAIEIIGEAASKITNDFYELHPEIPWIDIIGMRHRIVHAYFDINDELVWKTLQDDIPILLTNLERLIADHAN